MVSASFHIDYQFLLLVCPGVPVCAQWERAQLFCLIFPEKNEAPNFSLGGGLLITKC
jgi:hypothetical protein